MRQKTKIAIVGYGNIGRNIRAFIDDELSCFAEVTAIADNNPIVVDELKDANVVSLSNIEEAVKSCDLVLEAATGECAREILGLAVKYGKDIIILSVGGLINDFTLLDNAIKSGIKVYVPSGAICGLDGIGALGEGVINEIVITTSKPPRSLMGSDYFKKNGIQLDKITETTMVFEGDVADAIKYFPKNINVAATLLLSTYIASHNLLTRKQKLFAENKVKVHIKADPSLKRNVHKIEVLAQEAKVTIEVENVPSPGNPKTSTLTILSTQYLLRRIFASFRVGS